ncbi:MAG TPA: hypothetical protein VFT99_13125, partial [Roseiflexaceae bacterium]|nr:hypothetical protein [Roseiflexaceae bacterium]
MTIVPHSTSPVTIHQHGDTWSVAFYGKARETGLTSESQARIFAGLMQAVYEADLADLATCERVYGSAGALEAHLASRVGDSDYVSRPAALTGREGWSLPWNGYAGIVTGNCIELWIIECGRFVELAALFIERRQPPMPDRAALQNLTLAQFVAVSEHHAACYGWPVEVAYAWLRFYVEPWADDIRVSDDDPGEVLWYFGPTWYASRPAGERAALYQTAQEWFAAVYPD